MAIIPTVKYSEEHYNMTKDMNLYEIDNVRAVSDPSFIEMFDVTRFSQGTERADLYIVGQKEDQYIVIIYGEKVLDHMLTYAHIDLDSRDTIYDDPNIHFCWQYDNDNGHETGNQVLRLGDKYKITNPKDKFSALGITIQDYLGELSGTEYDENEEIIVSHEPMYLWINKYLCGNDQSAIYHNFQKENPEFKTISVYDYVKKTKEGMKACYIWTQLNKETENPTISDFIYHIEHKERVEEIKEVASTLPKIPVGTIVPFHGEQYGINPPDNFVRCDGRKIANPKAHPKLLNKYAPDFSNEVLACVDYKAIEKFDPNAHINPHYPNMFNHQGGTEFYKLSESHLPSHRIVIPQTGYRVVDSTMTEDGNHSHGIMSTCPIGSSSYKVPYSNSNWEKDQGSNVGGSGDYYPKQDGNGRIWSSNLQHAHDIGYSGKHDHRLTNITLTPTSFTWNNNDQSEIDRKQPTRYTNMYIVIY